MKEDPKASEDNDPLEDTKRPRTAREELMLLERKIQESESIQKTINLLWEWINMVLRVLSDDPEAKDKIQGYINDIKQIRMDHPKTPKFRSTFDETERVVEVKVGTNDMGRSYVGRELEILVEMAENYADKLYAADLFVLQMQMSTEMQGLIGWDDDPMDDTMTPEKRRKKYD